MLEPGIETVGGWFQFVDKRTNVDSRMFKKLFNAADDLEITQTEAQLLIRWFLLVPTIAKDKSDVTASKVLEHFIKQEKDAE